jgi:hypothetical protein
VTHETDPIGDRIRAASESVSAPLALREQLSRDSRRPRSRQPSRPALALLGFILAAVATVSAIVLPRTVTVERVAAAALRAPQGPAPAGESYLPGYEPVGVRTDDIEGRHARTVIYRRGGTGIHYTIVDGKPLDLPGTRRVRAAGRTLALARSGGVSLVVWHANGRTCILASRTAAPADMAALLRPA